MSLLVRQCSRSFAAGDWACVAQGPDAQAYTLAMSACFYGDRSELALDLLNLMPAQRVRTDTALFNGAMHAAVKTGHLDVALQLMETMRFCTPLGRDSDKHERDPNPTSLPPPPDKISYSIAIHASGQGGYWEDAVALLQEAQQRGIEMDGVAYATAITACAAARQVEQGLALMTDLQQRGITLDVHVHNAVIVCCGRAKDWEHAVDVLELMRSNGPAPNAASFNGVIKAICLYAPQRWKRALSVAQTMLADPNGPQPDRGTWRIIMGALATDGRWREALAMLVQVAQNHGIEPDSDYFDIAVASCARALQELHNADAEAEAEEVRGAVLDLVQQMAERGLHPSQRSYDTAISAASDLGDIETALSLRLSSQMNSPKQYLRHMHHKRSQQRPVMVK